MAERKVIIENCRIINNASESQQPLTTYECHCGAPECWDQGDYSWLDSKSGWRGNLHGCETAVFFIHGKKIREQRHIPTGHWTIAELRSLLLKWSEGLPNARFRYSSDTGDGEHGLWIEDEREPNSDDLARLDEVREREDRKDREELARLQRKLGTRS